MKNCSITLFIGVLIFISSCISAANNAVVDSLKYENVILREGDLDCLMTNLKTNKTLQLERLSAYLFHQKINQYRIANNLNTIYWDDRLWLTARNHCIYQANMDNIGHTEEATRTFFTGYNPTDRVRFVYYGIFELRLVGENVLQNWSDCTTLEKRAMDIAEKSFEQWRNSPPHNENMLDKNHFSHGTAFYITQKRKLYATTVFANGFDFVKHEIAIGWDERLAKLHPTTFVQKGKIFKPAEWDVKKDEEKVLSILNEKMPKGKSAFDDEMKTTASQQVLYQQTNNTSSTLQNKNGKNYVGTTTAKRYLKVAKLTPVSLSIATRLIEKSFVFTFSQVEFRSKSAFSVIDKKLSSSLPLTKRIKKWGGATSIIESDSIYSCVIDLIFIENK